MTRRHHGYALLSAVVALIVALSAALYAGVAADGSSRSAAVTGGWGRGHGASAAPASAGNWVGAWSASPVGGEPGTETEGLAGRSVRNVVHTTAAGTSARITLSNLYGQSALTISHASIALAAGHDTAAADAGTMRRLTFGGSASVVVPAGGQVVGDPVAIRVERGADVLVTTYSPTPSGPVTYHPRARQVSYVADGDRTRDAGASAYTGQTPYWRYLTALDVLSDDSVGTVVMFGDSLTDGITSTPGANRRWPFQGHRGWSPARETVRQEINERMRAGRVYDAVTDFDKALRDPYAPNRLRPYYDSGDHLHPNDSGFAKMADTFTLTDLRGGGSTEL